MSLGQTLFRVSDQTKRNREADNDGANKLLNTGSTLRISVLEEVSRNRNVLLLAWNLQPLEMLLPASRVCEFKSTDIQNGG